jgi:hypothetical protein
MYAIWSGLAPSSVSQPPMEMTIMIAADATSSRHTIDFVAFDDALRRFGRSRYVSSCPDSAIPSDLTIPVPRARHI